ncbi:MAG: PilT/PilU family type 4a pilus ATPase [Candidatus Omnitrophica bacterium]|nr:PilT/PilU family type 4a pilus ATPase [Candidatus Omnitrophota bacterium]
MNELQLRDLLSVMESINASDIHLQAGSQVAYRIKGEIVKQENSPALDEEKLRKIIFDVLSEKDKKTFEEKGTLDTAISFSGIGRFRMSVFLQRGSIALAARRISNKIPDFESLNLPEATKNITMFPNGLVLVTGPTGCGKSSTLAAIINGINRIRRCHIMCIEDPIEYLYKNELAIVNQREIGIDVPNFKEALRYIVRQDPDVILVGEIRDRETIEFALQAAETGHLVFGTLHSANVSQTINRILNFFPHSEHPSVRRSIAAHVKTVMSQMLLPSCREEVHLVPAVELMFTNSTISRLIIEEQESKIIKAIRAGKNEGMQDFEQSLYELITKGLITKEVGLEHADNPHSLDMKLRGITLSEEGGIIS